MTDHSDTLENDDAALIIPASTTAKIRLIKKLIAQRALLSTGLFCSFGVNVILILVYRL